MGVLICRSNPVAPDPRVEKMAKALTGLGYSVRILGWDRTGELAKVGLLLVEPHPSSQNSPGMPDDSGPGAGLLVKNIPVQRLSIRSQYGHGLMNLPNLLRWQVGLLKTLVRQRREYDVIHACDFDTVLPALICQKLWKKKVVYDIFDFYADHLRATPTLIKQMIRWLDIRAINQADALILADDSRFEQIRGAKPLISAVIYNSPEEELDGIRGGTVVPTTRPPDSAGLRIAYIGLLQIERGLLEMITVLQKHPEWSLDLAGFGGDEARLYSMVESMPNVHWHGRIPYSTALELSRAADVLFATYDPAIPNHRYSSPNKVFEAMLLSKPIIVARGTNMDCMIEQANCGLVVEYGDQAALEAALLHLQMNPAVRQHLGANGRRAYIGKYSWARMTERLADLYRKMELPFRIETPQQAQWR